VENELQCGPDRDAVAGGPAAVVLLTKLVEMVRVLGLALVDDVKDVPLFQPDEPPASASASDASDESAE
jgi:hypothetical protein